MSEELLNKGPYKRSDGPTILPEEPYITINGMRLTSGQAMTVRVAIESFATDLLTDGLGEDETGTNIKDGYLCAINDIRYAMYEIKIHE